MSQEENYKYFVKYVQEMTKKNIKSIVQPIDLINSKFENLCLHDSAEAIEKILENNNINQYIDLSHKEGRAFEFACISKTKDYLKKVKIIFNWDKNHGSSRKITNKNTNNVLLSLPKYKLDLAEYLIFDEKIELESGYEELLKGNKKTEILKLFEIRSFQEKLSDNLIDKNILTKKIKI